MNTNIAPQPSSISKNEFKIAVTTAKTIMAPIAMPPITPAKAPKIPVPTEATMAVLLFRGGA